MEKKTEYKTKFSPRRALAQAVKDQPGSAYAVELLLSPEDAEVFEYLSTWYVNEKAYRVAARLKKGDKILVQAKFIPNA